MRRLSAPEKSRAEEGVLSSHAIRILRDFGSAVMTKRVRAKYKIDRRLGQKLWGRAKSPLNKRESRPGQHGERRTSKPSDYGLQLKAKQKLKGYYGNILERQFRRIYEEARRFKGSTSEHLIGLLERRLDAIVYRAKFVPTVFAARQFVSHGHVKVNGRRVNIASYRCKIGDLIEVGDKGKQMALLLEAIKSTERDVPDYIEADHNRMTAKLLRVPGLGEVPFPVQMEPNLVVEFYSR
jgi:small subunit ribosomal protein S4